MPDMKYEDGRGQGRFRRTEMCAASPPGFAASPELAVFRKAKGVADLDLTLPLLISGWMFCADARASILREPSWMLSNDFTIIGRHQSPLY
jgi:hypothetical protein